MIENIVSYLALFALIWIFPFGYHLIIYSLGDKKHINQLVNDLAKEPETFKKKHYISMVSIGAGGLFSYFCLIYPFIRHRRKNKKITFDLFMWLNWVFFIVVIVAYLYA
ncbi:membrane protein [Aliivibrio wodanis]|uniref:Membrane protein n=1 Tax=Aliivibrio wodanis TaxID=80852 RepID=A0A090IDH0_9GAMM|nr:membrane protein [Aliivibrio wodanis]